MTESKLITGRRNFLVRALGFTAAGAAVSVPIVTVASAEERLRHHLAGAEAAMRDLFPMADVSICGNCVDGHYASYASAFARGDQTGPAAVMLLANPKTANNIRP